MELTNLLLENYQIFKVECLLKSKVNGGKTEIVNKIRAVPYVIIVRLREDPRLMAKSDDTSEYTLMSVKFLNVFNKPTDTLMRIRNIIKGGDETFHKIDGVIDFRPLVQTLKKVQ